MTTKPQLFAVNNTNLQEELIKVNNEIKSYLEKVEFYFEEPDSAKLESLQQRRTSLEIAISKLTTSTSTGPKNSRDSKDSKQILRKLNYLESQIEGLKSKLEKERKLRVKLHTRLQVYRQEILRYLYESHENLSVINWIGDMIAKKPTWGKPTNLD